MKFATLLFFFITTFSYSQEVQKDLHYSDVNNTEDWQDLLSKSSLDQKNILLYFSGSDWCGNCYALNKKVLNKPEFINSIIENFLLVNIDFPQKQVENSLMDESFKNQIADQFNNEGIFPRLVVINSKQEIISELKGYSGLSIQEVKDLLLIKPLL